MQSPFSSDPSASSDFSSMSGGQTIAANNGLTIQLHQQHWQLFAQNDPTPLAEASSDGLRYSTAFAQARHLPVPGLPPNAIETIVVGWAREDGCWHLGLMLAVDLIRERGGRWCGLARWSDPMARNEGLGAETAGRALADVLHRPFRLVTDQVETVSAAAPSPVSIEAGSASASGYVPAGAPLAATAAPSADTSTASALPDVRLLDPPVQVGGWALVAGPGGLIWTRSRSWQLETGLRSGFFLLLALAFIALAVGGLQTRFAAVQPDWLPIVGLIVGVVLAVNALYHLIGLFTAYSVEFDRRSQMIRFVRRPVGVVKQVPFEKVNYILISQATLREERLKNQPPDSGMEQVALEAWLHLARDKGDFVEIAHTLSEGRAVRDALRAPRRMLTVEELDTPIHQAARLIAQQINVLALVEDRS